MYLLSLIKQMCEHMHFEPEVQNDEFYQREAASYLEKAKSLKTVDEADEKSSASSLVPSMVEQQLKRNKSMNPNQL